MNGRKIEDRKMKTGTAWVRMWGRHLAARNTRQGCPVNRQAGSLTHIAMLPSRSNFSALNVPVQKIA
jgi:hypothetical protein